MRSRLRWIFFIQPRWALPWHLREASFSSVDLRDTLARQTGMYAVVRRITDEQAESVIAGNLQSHEWMLASHPLVDLARQSNAVDRSLKCLLRKRNSIALRGSMQFARCRRTEDGQDPGGVSSRLSAPVSGSMWTMTSAR